MSRLTGIHAVREALEAGRAIDRIVIASGRHGERVEELVQAARSRGVPVRFEDRAEVDHLAGTRDHQGVVALEAARKAASLEDILQTISGDTSRRGLLVLLDGVEDPQNLGAIVCTALAAGAHGIVIPERRAAGLTESVESSCACALAQHHWSRGTYLVRLTE